MAPTTPVGIPTELHAGDSLVCTLSYPDYPSSEGWALSLALRGASVLDSASGELTAGTSGTDVNIPASRTAALEPGVYRWFVRATGSGSYAGRVDTADAGTLTILRNPTTASEGDYQSQAEKDLAVVTAALSGRLSDDMQAYLIAGRQVTLIPIAELRRLQSSLRREVWREQHPDQAFPTAQAVFGGCR